MLTKYYFYSERIRLKDILSLHSTQSFKQVVSMYTFFCICMFSCQCDWMCASMNVWVCVRASDFHIRTNHPPSSSSLQASRARWNITVFSVRTQSFAIYTQKITVDNASASTKNTPLCGICIHTTIHYSFRGIHLPIPRVIMIIVINVHSEIDSSRSTVEKRQLRMNLP